MPFNPLEQRGIPLDRRSRNRRDLDGEAVVHRTRDVVRKVVGR
ncbi:hypothetical protein [Streptomyces mesophilus]